MVDQPTTPPPEPTPVPAPPPEPTFVQKYLGGTKPLPALIAAIIGLVAGLGVSGKRVVDPPPTKTVWADRTNWLAWTNVQFIAESNKAYVYVEAPFRETNKIFVRIGLTQTGDTNDPWKVDIMEMRMPDGWAKEHNQTNQPPK